MEEKIDMRIRKTYLGLHTAFTQLLEEKKFEDFTVNELCDRAMIRRATFYKHFADKYDYFAFYMKELISLFQESLSPSLDNCALDTYLVHMARELLRFMAEHEGMVKNVMDSNMFPTLLAALLEQIRFDFTQVLRRSVPAGESSSPDLEGIAAFYAGGLLSTLFQMSENGGTPDEEQFIRILTRFLGISV